MGQANVANVNVTANGNAVLAAFGTLSAATATAGGNVRAFSVGNQAATLDAGQDILAVSYGTLLLDATADRDMSLSSANDLRAVASAGQNMTLVSFEKLDGQFEAGFDLTRVWARGAIGADPDATSFDAAHSVLEVSSHATIDASIDAQGTALPNDPYSGIVHLVQAWDGIDGSIIRLRLPHFMKSRELLEALSGLPDLAKVGDCEAGRLRPGAIRANTGQTTPLAGGLPAFAWTCTWLKSY